MSCRCLEGEFKYRVMTLVCWGSLISLSLSLSLGFCLFPPDRLLVMGFTEFMKSRSGLRIDNKKTTSAATLTLRQSLWPLTLVTILFFLWVCS
jgi:hypothetical protein